MEIKVPDMMCVHCVAKIEKALAKGGIAGKVDLASKTVLVDDKDVEVAKTLIVKQGYTVA